jgi:erythrin-vacuolar iron transport family protein
MTVESTSLADDRRKTFILQEIQPGLLGLMDGSVSTLAPIFATAGLTGRPLSAFFVGLAASLGAAISMGLSEALSDDGSVTGRGNPLRRGAITGFATGLGGMLHTFPFMIPNLGVALKLAWLYVSSSQSPSFVTASWVASLPAPSCRLSSAAASYSRSALGSDVSAQAEPREGKRTTAKEYRHEDRIHRIGAYGRWHGGEPPEGRP